MAVSETPRHKLKQYSAGTDPHPTRTTFNGEVSKLEELPAIKQGSTGNRPVSGVGKVLYWDASVKRFVYDDGTEWQDVAPIGGVKPSKTSANSVSSEGTSHRAARADHTHDFPMAAGIVVIPIATANQATSFHVAFPLGKFLKAPFVTLGLLSEAGRVLEPVSFVDVTNTGCTVWVKRAVTGQVAVHWIAVEA